MLEKMEGNGRISTHKKLKENSSTNLDEKLIKAKVKWMKQKCEEIEKLERK